MAHAVAWRAMSEGSDVLLAGRDADTGAWIASQIGIPYMHFDLSSKMASKNLPKDVTGILNTAGPFSLTGPPLVRHCLARRINYIDLSNEHLSHRYVWEMSAEAASIGAILVSGAGYGALASERLLDQAKCEIPGINPDSPMTRPKRVL